MEESINQCNNDGLSRRSLLKTGMTLAGGSLLLAPVTKAQKQNFQNTETNILRGRRKLGSLEVSSVGIGVQNMPRTYQTTIPSRPEMINIIRKAFDQGVTLFDTAEAYGPFESERILGEAISPFRNKVVIETKFGWNVDQKTGQRFEIKGGIEKDGVYLAIEGEKRKEAEKKIKGWLQKIGMIK